MNDHVPLRVSVHRGRPNVMAAKAVVRPKLFPGKAHIRIVRDAPLRRGSSFLFMVSFRFGQQIPGGAREEEKPSRQDTAKQDSYHVPLRLETHRRLKKQRVSITLAVWLVPFVGGFYYCAGT